MPKFSDQLHKGLDPLRKLRVFLAGLQTAIGGDFSVTVQVVLSLLVLGVSLWLREWLDFMLILIVTGYMLSAELFNTAIETICDYLQPEYDPRIGAIKDVAAAAAGLSILVWVCTLSFELWRMWQILQQP
ncbi:MAG: diacylglycerol kinase [Caldilineaceae bacterium]